MASLKAAVKLTANFESHLVSIDAFWRDRDVPQAFLQLLDELEIIIANLEQYPFLGRSFLNRTPQSLETSERVSEIKRRFVDINVREYVFGDYIILYSVDGISGTAGNLLTVHLLAIRHHRQLSFDFEIFWGSNHRS